MALASVAVIWRSRAGVPWHGTGILVGVLVFAPWLQYSAGLVTFAGQAWVSTAYLLGLLLALLTGQRWERVGPDQLVNGLFWAIGLASVLSVNLQLQTWLGLMDTGILDLWSMGLTGARPYANLGQPNQLATLLLWGLLAGAWAYHSEKIGGQVALLLAGFLLLGIALTQSRTAWFGLFFLLLASCIWRRLWRSKWVPWAVTGLFLFFWACLPLLKTVADLLLLGAEQEYFRPILQAESRPLAWRIFIEAALGRPWFGYGWHEVSGAQLAVAADFPSLNVTFAQAHNLFLDLVLWLGLPIGIFVSVALIWWFFSTMRAVSNAKDAILIMFLGVVGIHAMLELPLHYAYFLLPVGLVIGVLNQRVGIRPLLISPRWTLMVLWLMAVMVLSVIVRDYFRVESSFQRLRFEQARIGTAPAVPPDVILLSQLRELISFMRYQTKAGMSAQELEWVQQVASAYPGGGNLYKVAFALALNGRSKEAQLWLKKICKISSVEECELIKRVWTADSLANPLIATVPWPD